ncbi:MAG TPA: serine/threonine-protein kinase [Bryobacteraceae bacterium]|nr:serine/threonine-protein kinase [Bryobacteraceae bacterium]
MLDSEREQRLDAIYSAALKQDASRRPQFLEEACGDDAALRQEIESLLGDERKLGDFLEKPALQAAGFAMAGGNERWLAGQTLGPYDLLELIGAGGMGEVWLAEQKQPVHRRVALKLIKAGMDTREVVARFESERQALALMEHPNIAKVFDAGATPQGRPYFVMEYVAGIPITEYCDQHRMTLHERLELFVHVCEGVQHAHQKAVIHRDLKPSNILVSEVDGKPVPRIIDFGLAKATSQPLSAEGMFTQAGAIVGTPTYMSPEQAGSTGVDVDTRTDVYSLGVVLYELLVGVAPLDFHKLALDEMLRRLREEEAPRPSTKARALGEASGAAAENRGCSPAGLARQLRGDLDAITLKALEKERARRYATPSELVADIVRYLRNEPVLARPARASYRTRKYLRRHRIGVAVAAGLLVVLISFGAAQTLQLRRITRERDRADRIAAFMTGMFKVSDPSAARGNSITAREILDKASKEIDTALSKDPELQAQMMQAMGDVYHSLGLFSQAQSLHTRAVDIRRRVLGPQHPDTLTSMNSLGASLAGQGRYAEAEKLNRATLEMRRRVLGPEHPDTLKSMSNLAIALRGEGRFAEAEKLNRETLEIRRRVLGPEHPDTLQSMSNLAPALHQEGRYAEAEKLNRETLEIRRRVLGPDHPDTLKSMGNLAVDLYEEGRYAEAEKLDHEAVEIQRRVSGPEHPNTLSAMNNLALILYSEGRYAEAEKLDRETLDIRRRVLGPEHLETLLSKMNLALVLDKEDRHAEAEKLLRETLDIQRRVLGPDHPRTALSTYNLGVFSVHQGNRGEALSLLQDAVDHGLPPNVDLGIEKDPDLQSLHGDPRFPALVAHAKERAAAARKPK